MRTHWEELLVALIETVLRGSRDLTPTETTAIEVAITEATRYSEASGNLDRLAPIHLHLIVDLLLNPTPTMAAETRMTVADLADLLRESGLALRKLTRGSLQGLVDAPEANQLDPTIPGDGGRHLQGADLRRLDRPGDGLHPGRHRAGLGASGRATLACLRRVLADRDVRQTRRAP